MSMLMSTTIAMPWYASTSCEKKINTDRRMCYLCYQMVFNFLPNLPTLMFLLPRLWGDSKRRIGMSRMILKCYATIARKLRVSCSTCRNCMTDSCGRQCHCYPSDKDTHDRCRDCGSFRETLNRAMSSTMPQMFWVWLFSQPLNGTKSQTVWSTMKRDLTLNWS